jgi:uncharacterized protein YjbJ (UPF0337 family)
MRNKTLTQKGVEHSARGKANKVKGRIKDGVGGLTGDSGLQLEGKLQAAKGKVQDAFGKAERKVDRQADGER